MSTGSDAVRLDASDLRALMERGAEGPGQLCRVIIQNRTPPAWGAVIIAVGTKFFNEGGTEFTDGPHSVTVAAGGDTSTSNNDPGMCVKAESTFVTVKVPNQAPVIVQGNEQCPADQCLLQATHILAPKRSILKATHRDASLADLLELRVE